MVDFPTDKIPVTVLGATGPIGQQFVRLLDGHPWFEVTAVTGDSQFAGRPYADATRWLEPEPIPDRIAAMPLRRPEPALGGRIAFSALPADGAGAGSWPPPPPSRNSRLRSSSISFPDSNCPT